MKQKLVPLLGIAFVVALISTGIFYGLFLGKSQGASADQPHASVVVAAHSLARGAVIQTGDLKTVPGATNEPPKGSFAAPELATGFTVLDPIEANQLVTESHVASHR